MILRLARVRRLIVAVNKVMQSQPGIPRDPGHHEHGGIRLALQDRIYEGAVMPHSFANFTLLSPRRTCSRSITAAMFRTTKRASSVSRRSLFAAVIPASAPRQDLAKPHRYLEKQFRQLPGQRGWPSRCCQSVCVFPIQSPEASTERHQPQSPDVVASTPRVRAPPCIAPDSYCPSIKNNKVIILC